VGKLAGSVADRIHPTNNIRQYMSYEVGGVPVPVLKIMNRTRAFWLKLGKLFAIHMLGPSNEASSHQHPD
jgi:hypothetical protein